MENLYVPVSVGEVIDKITILQIKNERISDASKVANVRKELNLLLEVCAKNNINLTIPLVAALKRTNEDLWEIEDKIRVKEKAKAFDDEFIALARSVYVTNDRRAKEKGELNKHFGSQLFEEKSYEKYQ
jgi:hypothetical protein